MKGPRVAADRKSTRLNSSHTEIYTLSLHDALPIFAPAADFSAMPGSSDAGTLHLNSGTLNLDEGSPRRCRSEEHTSELQSHRDLHSFPTRRSSDLCSSCGLLRYAGQQRRGDPSSKFRYLEFR